MTFARIASIFFGVFTIGVVAVGYFFGITAALIMLVIEIVLIIGYKLLTFYIQEVVDDMFGSRHYMPSPEESRGNR